MRERHNIKTMKNQTGPLVVELERCGCLEEKCYNKWNRCRKRQNESTNRRRWTSFMLSMHCITNGVWFTQNLFLFRVSCILHKHYRVHTTTNTTRNRLMRGFLLTKNPVSFFCEIVKWKMVRPYFRVCASTFFLFGSTLLLSFFFARKTAQK